MTEPTPRRKKRAHPARKIVPRGQMSLAWVVGSVVIAGIILVLGIVFLVVQPR